MLLRFFSSLRGEAEAISFAEEIAAALAGFAMTAKSFRRPGYACQSGSLAKEVWRTRSARQYGMKTTVIPVMISALFLCACSSHQNKPDVVAPSVHTEYSVQRDVVITPEHWPQQLLADVYLPEGEGPWPGVLVIHGGGWAKGDRAQVESIAERLAARGYVAVNTTYRFAPQWHFPAQLQDVQQALRWMRDHAGDYRMRPERFGAFGYSAGAHLAALAGGVGTEGELGKDAVPIAAVVAGGTPTDLMKYPGGKLVPDFIGASRDEDPDGYKAASPVNYVDAADPPVFLYHGGSDTLVPKHHAVDYKALLDEAGVTNELFILRLRGHIGAFYTDGGAVKAAIAFLDRHLRAQ